MIEYQLYSFVFVIWINHVGFIKSYFITHLKKYLQKLILSFFLVKIYKIKTFGG